MTTRRCSMLPLTPASPTPAPSTACSLLHILPEEAQRPTPCVIRRGLVIATRVLVVEEGVIDVRVDVDFALLAGLLDGGVDGASVVGLHELVLIGEEAEH